MARVENHSLEAIKRLPVQFRETEIVPLIQAFVSPSLPIDGPDDVTVPAVIADWDALGLAPPTRQWNCQDTSGVLLSSIGDTSLTVLDDSGDATHRYGQKVADWTRNFVGFTDEESLGQGWISSDVALRVEEDQDCAFLMYASVEAPAANRDLFVLNAATDNGAAIESSGFLTVYSNSVTAAGVDDNSPIETVRPYLWTRDKAAGTVKMFTDQEEITHGTPSFEVLAGIFALGNAAAGRRVPELRVGLISFWVGTSFDETLLETLGWTLAY